MNLVHHVCSSRIRLNVVLLVAAGLVSAMAAFVPAFRLVG